MLSFILLGQAIQKPIHLSVTDIEGVSHAVPAASKATLFLFVGVDCPIANRMAPEIARILRDYKARDVSAFLVYPDGTLKRSDVAAHLKSFSLEGTAVIDKGLKLVKATRASVTPQAIVVDPKGVIRYSGRINDLYEEHGKIKARPTRNDLRVALDELLAGKKVSNPTTQLVGCFIAGA